ncbi:MAG: hypothetical protein WC799_16805 [Desulfobacteraceae bacterium]|jgi:hypothetical protein
MKDLICYCFGYTVLNIEQDIAENGRSTLMERIVEEKRKNDTIHVESQRDSVS